MYAICLPDYKGVKIKDIISLYICKINELLVQLHITVQYNVYLCERLHVINIYDNIILYVCNTHCCVMGAYQRVKGEAQGSVYRGSATYDGRVVEAEAMCSDFKQIAACVEMCNSNLQNLKTQRF